MSAADQVIANHILLHGIDWRLYSLLRDELGERPVRLTFDRGNLEIMSPSALHEWLSRLVGKLVDIVTLELNIPVLTVGSTTFRQEAVERGIEADGCYYLSIDKMARAKSLSLRPASPLPAPDLAIEIEVTRRAILRLPIYAALGVPEIWLYDGQSLRVHVLAANEYQESRTSSAFPFLDIAVVEQFLSRRDEMDETSLMRRFRDWVVATYGPGREADG